MRWHTQQCEIAMDRREPQKMVDHTTAEARLANRVYMVAKQEADNSEDPVYNARVNRAAEGVQAGMQQCLSILPEHTARGIGKKFPC